MKRYTLAVVAILLCSSSFAQRPYNVVFDLTSGDTVDHKMVINWLQEITDNDPSAKLEVVFYAKSLDMVTKGKSVVEKQVEHFAKNKSVAFRVCAIAMQKHKLTKSDLVEGVEPVTDGIYEIISKQGEGYGYIKATR